MHTDAMNRVSLNVEHPSSYKLLLALAQEAEVSALAAGLDATVVELVKLRVSQLNGCAYCQRLHVREALARGESTDRLAVLPSWRETEYFSGVEQAALSLAEDVTRITERDARPGTAALEELTPEQFSAVAWVATVMNALNRVAITSRYSVAPENRPEPGIR